MAAYGRFRAAVLLQVTDRHISPGGEGEETIDLDM